MHFQPRLRSPAGNPLPGSQYRRTELHCNHRTHERAKHFHHEHYHGVVLSKIWARLKSRAQKGGLPLQVLRHHSDKSLPALRAGLLLLR